MRLPTYWERRVFQIRWGSPVDCKPSPCLLKNLYLGAPLPRTRLSHKTTAHESDKQCGHFGSRVEGLMLVEAILNGGF